MSEKSNGRMTIMEMMMGMSEGNPGAMMVIREMMSDPARLFDILLLDSMEIHGAKLYTLNNDCCERDPSKFSRTLMMFQSGVFTQEQIHANLEQCHALPFIDDSIEMDGIPPYGEDFGPDHPKWDEWCKVQKESFENRSKS